mmetsp:Transcript_46773/g.53125  ORF Transcript_46773/g.53125 Transcript_46773/m.53125 type:complete len:87 (+) Transcript_46773:113-373(+)
MTIRFDSIRLMMYFLYLLRDPNIPDTSRRYGIFHADCPHNVLCTTCLEDGVLPTLLLLMMIDDNDEYDSEIVIMMQRYQDRSECKA